MGRVYIVYIKALKTHKKKKAVIFCVFHTRYDRTNWFGSSLMSAGGEPKQTKTCCFAKLDFLLFFFSFLTVVLRVCVDFVGNRAHLYLFVDGLRGRNVS